MKTNALLAFFFFFLVALFAPSRAEFVRDSEGHLVANGGIYELVPQHFADAALLGTSITDPDGSSPVGVLEMLKQGIATLIETKLLAAHVTTDYPLQISFYPLQPDQCTKHPEWIVEQGENVVQKPMKVGEASDPVSAGCFYFKSYDSCRHLYSLVFCSHHKCGQVAVKTDGGHRRLIVAAEQESVCPLVLKLVKRSRDHVPCDISMVVGSNLHNN